MIRKHITRSIPVATIKAFSVTPVDGKPVITELEPVEAYGRPSNEEAIKAVKAVYGKDIVVTIASVDVEVRAYRCPIAAFVSCADRVENSDEVDTDETDD